MIGAPRPAAAGRAMAAQVDAALLEGADMRLSTEELEGVEGEGLGRLDITTQQVSLAGLEKELEAMGDSEVLRRILDEGELPWGGGGRRWVLPCLLPTSPPLVPDRRGPSGVQPSVRGAAARG